MITTIPTATFDSILIQFARLAQFERLMVTKAEHDPRLAAIIKMVQLDQGPVVLAGDAALEQLRPLEVGDLPIVLSAAHKHLHDQLGQPSLLDATAINAAVAAFVGLLCRR